jgi:hypothetical protein
VPGASDIYITGSGISEEQFYVGINETESSSAVYSNAEANDFVAEGNPTIGSIEFDIYVPIATANALTDEPPDTAPNISQNRENIIRQIADLYTYAGINYNIITY